MELKNGERIDDLQINGLKIIQNKEGFCFGIDAVLLSDFAKGMKRADTVVDLCSGNGVIALLLTAKVKNLKKVYAVEIQKDVAEMAQRSVILNNLEGKIEIINRDLNSVHDLIPYRSVDAITVNPPYKAKKSGIINAEDSKTISRHEIFCTLEDIMRESARMLRSGGNIYMVHRTERLVDIMCFMRKYGLEPKRIRFVHPNYSCAPNLVLIEGVKDGKPFLNFEKPLYVYDEDGKYTEDILEIYNKKRD